MSIIAYTGEVAWMPDMIGDRVYALALGPTAIKIGVSTNPARRMADMGAAPSDCVVVTAPLGSAAASRRMEQALLRHSGLRTLSGEVVRLSLGGFTSLVRELADKKSDAYDRLSRNARIGAMIRDARLSAGLTQSQLATMTKKGRVAINYAESGRYSTDVATLVALAGALNLDLGGLLADKPRRRA